MIRIIPVLDVLDGIVVRGIAGQREKYRPIVSRLTTSSNPLDVARALLEYARPKELYLADLDGIMHDRRNHAVYATLQTLRVPVWVDAGIRSWENARELVAAGCEHIILGLETLPGLTELEAVIATIGAEQLIFSLDLKAGKLLGCPEGWPLPWHPMDLVQAVVQRGLRRLILLDLGRVGMATGPGTEDLCHQIVSNYPGVEVVVGGGVRSWEDLQRFASLGASAALVASALHDGWLAPQT